MIIEDLVGETLSAGSFARDYVELHFEETVVRVLTPPVVVADGACYEFPAAGSPQGNVTSSISRLWAGPALRADRIGPDPAERR